MNTNAMLWATGLSLCLALLLGACADDAEPATVTTDASDVASADATADATADAAVDATPDSGTDATTDAGADDAAGPDVTGDAQPFDVKDDSSEAAGDAGDGDTGADTVTPPDLPHYALSVIHMNVQYVAGGTEGIIASLGGLLANPPGFEELDEAELEDQIIVESFLPILWLLDAHPSWTLTIELQGYMIEILMDRHPETLALLQKLNLEGRVELVSFHYSDQLFTAGHYESMDRSLAMNEAVFAAAGLVRSKAIFAQEGQFGEGMARLMLKYGYDLALIPRNLWKFLKGDEFETAPLYAMRGTQAMVGGRSVDDAKSGIKTTWVFFDDGEKLMTNDLDPYLSNLFVFHQESYDDFEKKLMDLEAQGWKITGIEQYRDAMVASGTDMPPLPPVLDGSWQPKNSNNMFRWMGGSGVWGAAERDNAILTGVVRTRHALLAAEIANGDAKGPEAALIADGWRELLLGEVSDSTGWNPWNGEVSYAFTHIGAAQALAEQALASLLGPDQQVDILAGEVQAATQPVELGDVVEPLVPVIAEGQGWDIATEWRSHPDGGAVLSVTFAPASESPQRNLSVQLPFTATEIIYSPALLEDEVVTAPLSAFAFSSIGLPLANGLLGLAPDLYLVKDMQTVHLAAVIDPGAQTVTFRDETSPTDGTVVTWRFLLLQDVTVEAARARAEQMNVHPVWRQDSL